MSDASENILTKEEILKRLGKLDEESNEKIQRFENLIDIKNFKEKIDTVKNTKLEEIQRNIEGLEKISILTIEKKIDVLDGDATDLVTFKSICIKHLISKYTAPENTQYTKRDISDIKNLPTMKTLLSIEKEKNIINKGLIIDILNKKIELEEIQIFKKFLQKLDEKDNKKNFATKFIVELDLLLTTNNKIISPLKEDLIKKVNTEENIKKIESHINNFEEINSPNIKIENEVNVLVASFLFYSEQLNILRGGDTVAIDNLVKATDSFNNGNLPVKDIKSALITLYASKISNLTIEFNKKRDAIDLVSLRKDFIKQYKDKKSIDENGKQIYTSEEIKKLIKTTEIETIDEAIKTLKAILKCLYYIYIYEKIYEGIEKAAAEKAAAEAAAAADAIAAAEKAAAEAAAEAAAAAEKAAAAAKKAAADAAEAAKKAQDAEKKATEKAAEAEEAAEKAEEEAEKAAKIADIKLSPLIPNKEATEAAAAAKKAAEAATEAATAATEAEEAATAAAAITEASTEAKASVKAAKASVTRANDAVIRANNAVMRAKKAVEAAKASVEAAKARIKVEALAKDAAKAAKDAATAAKDAATAAEEAKKAADEAKKAAANIPSAATADEAKKAAEAAKEAIKAATTAVTAAKASTEAANAAKAANIPSAAKAAEAANTSAQEANASAEAANTSAKEAADAETKAKEAAATKIQSATRDHDKRQDAIKLRIKFLAEDAAAAAKKAEEAAEEAKEAAIKAQDAAAEANTAATKADVATEANAAADEANAAVVKANAAVVKANAAADAANAAVKEADKANVAAQSLATQVATIAAQSLAKKAEASAEAAKLSAAQATAYADAATSSAEAAKQAATTAEEKAAAAKTSAATIIKSQVRDYYTRKNVREKNIKDLKVKIKGLNEEIEGLKAEKAAADAAPADAKAAEEEVKAKTEEVKAEEGKKAAAEAEVKKAEANADAKEIEYKKIRKELEELKKKSAQRINIPQTEKYKQDSEKYRKDHNEYQKITKTQEYDKFIQNKKIKLYYILDLCQHIDFEKINLFLKNIIVQYDYVSKDSELHNGKKFSDTKKKEGLKLATENLDYQEMLEVMREHFKIINGALNEFWDGYLANIKYYYEDSMGKDIQVINTTILKILKILQHLRYAQGIETDSKFDISLIADNSLIYKINLYDFFKNLIYSNLHIIEEPILDDDNYEEKFERSREKLNDDFARFYNDIYKDFEKRLHQNISKMDIMKQRTEYGLSDIINNIESASYVGTEDMLKAMFVIQDLFITKTQEEKELDLQLEKVIKEKISADTLLKKEKQNHTELVAKIQELNSDIAEKESKIKEDKKEIAEKNKLIEDQIAEKSKELEKSKEKLEELNIVKEKIAKRREHSREELKEIETTAAAAPAAKAARTRTKVKALEEQVEQQEQPAAALAKKGAEGTEEQDAQAAAEKPAAAPVEEQPVEEPPAPAAEEQDAQAAAAAGQVTEEQPVAQQLEQSFKYSFAPKEPNMTPIYEDEDKDHYKIRNDPQQNAKFMASVNAGDAGMYVGGSGINGGFKKIINIAVPMRGVDMLLDTAKMHLLCYLKLYEIPELTDKYNNLKEISTGGDEVKEFFEKINTKEEKLSEKSNSKSGKIHTFVIEEDQKMDLAFSTAISTPPPSENIYPPLESLYFKEVYLYISEKYEERNKVQFKNNLFPGDIFIDVFKDNVKILNNGVNKAMIYCVGPDGRPGNSKDTTAHVSKVDFLKSIKMVGKNIANAIFEYNNMNILNKIDTEKIDTEKIDYVRICLISAAIFAHPELKDLDGKIEIAKNLIEGIHEVNVSKDVKNVVYNFAHDQDAFKTAFLQLKEKKRKTESVWDSVELT
jgi:hypothetical protein